jgi:hypothetical protein
MTAQQYTEHLKRIEATNPAEPLLRSLRAGWSRVNVIYMKSALNRLPKVDTQPDRATTDDIEDQETASTDPIIRELWSQKGQLFRERAKFSNRFHDCTTDEQRKANSEAILRIWDRIMDIQRKMEYYEENGELPAGAERFPLPDDPAALLKKLMSIRSQISMEQQKLRRLAELSDEDPQKRPKIEESQAKLAELKLYRGHAEQKAKTDIHD